VIFRMWDLNFGTWISHRGLHSGLRPWAPTSNTENSCHANTVTKKDGLLGRETPWYITYNISWIAVASSSETGIVIVQYPSTLYSYSFDSKRKNMLWTSKNQNSPVSSEEPTGLLCDGSYMLKGFPNTGWPTYTHQTLHPYKLDREIQRSWTYQQILPIIPMYILKIPFSPEFPQQGRCSLLNIKDLILSLRSSKPPQHRRTCHLDCP